jgi:hypothetical protein
MGRRIIDLSGLRFGKWVVIQRGKDRHGHAQWICRCDCGIVKPVSGSSLREGGTTNCGCFLQRNKPVEQRFWKNVDKDTLNSCWKWVAGVSNTGYGSFGINNINYASHRVAWMLTNGDIPDGMCVCHKCDNRLCCNPDHLFLGTLNDNNQDMKQKGRNSAGRGEQSGNHKFTEKDILSMRNRYARGEVTQVNLAKEYSSTRQYINLIIHHKYWKSVGG